MNFQQVGYAQALVDLGFQKEAGLFSGVSKRISNVFKPRAVAAAPVTPATPSGMLGDPGFRYSKMPTGSQNQAVPIPSYLSNFKAKPASQWGGRPLPKPAIAPAPSAINQATLPGISREKMHEYFLRQSRQDSESLKQSLRHGSLESDLTLDDLRSHLSGILRDAA
jgi:hypothetical protein